MNLTASDIQFGLQCDSITDSTHVLFVVVAIVVAVVVVAVVVVIVCHRRHWIESVRF